MATPNSTKVRQTKVRLEWFYDPSRETWRFLPADLSHRAEYERTDAAGDPLQPVRAYENKGWIPAEQAIQYNKASRSKMPDAVKERYSYLLDATQGEKVGS